jgi:hypothetical protein
MPNTSRSLLFFASFQYPSLIRAITPTIGTGIKKAFSSSTNLFAMLFSGDTLCFKYTLTTNAIEVTGKNTAPTTNAIT